MVQFLMKGLYKTLTSVALIDIVRNMDRVYDVYLEKQYEKTTTDPDLQQLDIQQLESRPTPPHCRRHLWIDA